MTYISQRVVIGFVIGVVLAQFVFAVLKNDLEAMFDLTLYTLMAIVAGIIIPKFTGEARNEQN